MKTLLATLAAVGALTAAAPAAAQPGYDRYDEDRYDRGWDDGRYDRGGYGDRWDRGYRQGWYGSERAGIAERRIEHGLRNGSLTPDEAWRLRDDIREYVRLERRLSYDGLSRLDRNQLDIRFDRVMRRITNASRDHDYGYYR